MKHNGKWNKLWIIQKISETKWKVNQIKNNCKNLQKRQFQSKFLTNFEKNNSVAQKTRKPLTILKRCKKKAKGNEWERHNKC